MSGSVIDRLWGRLESRYDSGDESQFCGGEVESAEPKVTPDTSEERCRMVE
jgi:hypothetical protein